jgi:TIR domain
MTNKNDNYRYDIALSFAGEDREQAKSFAEMLRRRGVNVFYDEYEQAVLWGKDLYQHLQNVYRDSARFCIVFLSEAYARKLWTRHELKQAQARAFRESQEYLLPIRLDDTELPGVNPTTGYIDLRQTSLEAMAELVVQKLLQASGWDTWHETKTDINEFSIKLRTGVDTVVSSASSIVLNLFTDETLYSPGLVMSAREAFQGIQPEPGLDIELTCLDDSGVFIYHPWPGIIGRTLISQWSHRMGFTDWFLHRIREMGRGYLTWKDEYSSDPDLEIELVLVPRNYQRRTILGFRRFPVSSQLWWIVAVEGHEIASLGPLRRLT